MSLVDLTRNAFQSGIPAPKWSDLCSIFISKQSYFEAEDTERAVSNSVLVLFASYPGDPALHAYITCALQKGLLSLNIFVATFLQAARSPELHNPATLELLCHTAVENSFSTSIPSLGSIISESPDAALSTIGDALALLQMVHNLPVISGRLSELAGNLLLLMLHSFTDLSKASSAQAMACIDDAKLTLQTLFQLRPDVRQALENLVVSLSFFADEDPTITREVKMIHTMQSSLAKGDILGSGIGGHDVSCALLLYHLVLNRAKPCGSGNDVFATSMMMATFQSTFWPLGKFYVQLFTAAINCLVQDLQSTKKTVWRAFVLGRLPSLLVLFEKAFEGDNNLDAHSALREAWGSICIAQHMNPLLMQYDSALSMPSTDYMHDGNTQSSSFAHDFTQQLLVVGLLDQMFALKIDATLANETPSRIQMEAREAGTDIESFIGTKLSPDLNADDVTVFLERIYENFSCHPVFASVLRKRFETLATSYEIDGLGHLAKTLYMNDTALDILSLHIPLSGLLSRSLALVDSYDCESVGDPQTAVSHLGDVVLFLQSTAARYKLPLSNQSGNAASKFLQNLDTVYRSEELTAEQVLACDAWIKAMFDKGSEGIEDGILRSTRPKTLLTMAATLCLNAITSCIEHKIDADMLHNGMSYFLGPLLNWTLVGIVKALLKKIKHTNFQSPHHLAVLRTVALSPSCPRPVLCLCGFSILRLLSDPSLQRFIPKDFDVSSIRDAVNNALSLPNRGTTNDALAIPAFVHWKYQPRHAMQDALASIRSGKPPILDVAQCIHVVPPTQFLQLFWDEISMALSLGANIDALRHFAVFILAAPRTPGTPPLLPILLHNVAPALMGVIDRQPAATQSMNAELLVAVLSSSIMFAHHLERAMPAAHAEQGHTLGEASVAMASRLATDLRHRKHGTTAKHIAHRLASSSTFVTNFPAFKTEI